MHKSLTDWPCTYKVIWFSSSLLASFAKQAFYICPRSKQKCNQIYSFFFFVVLSNRKTKLFVHHCSLQYAMYDLYQVEFWLCPSELFIFIYHDMFCRDHKAVGRRPFDKMATLLAYLGPPEHKPVADTHWSSLNLTSSKFEEFMTR